MLVPCTSVLDISILVQHKLYLPSFGPAFVVNLDGPSDVPALAEPWFLTFYADVEFRIAMTPEDLARAGLDALGKKWA